MTHVTAPSRLHFGLLHVPASEVLDRPQFGGCGLMIDAPGVSVSVHPAEKWRGEGPNAERALRFAKQVTAVPHFVRVNRCPTEHIGLGVGTSLGLAVAKALEPDKTSVELARLVGRGLRSGVGLHGFDLGGFIIDGGKNAVSSLPRLVRRHEFPSSWRVALIVPNQPAYWSGPLERAAFARLQQGKALPACVSRMEELLDHTLAPAVAAADYQPFSEALGEYNRLAGAAFAEEQGGAYTGRIVTAIIEAVRDLGYRGVGQSSWGPTVFAVVPDAEAGGYLTDVIWGRFAGLKSAEVVNAADSGAKVEVRATIE